MLTLTQLILFGLLATCATGFFVEKPSAVKQIKWTPGSAGQPKWTLDVQLKYSAIGTPFDGVILSPSTFDVDGELMNMTVRFWKTRSIAPYLSCLSWLSLKRAERLIST